MHGMHTRKTNDESFAKCEIATHSTQQMLAQCFLENQIRNRMACNQPIIINERTSVTLLHIHTSLAETERTKRVNKKNRIEVKQLSRRWQMNVYEERETEREQATSNECKLNTTDECAVAVCVCFRRRINAYNFIVVGTAAAAAIYTGLWSVRLTLFRVYVLHILCGGNRVAAATAYMKKKNRRNVEEEAIKK